MDTYITKSGYLLDNALYFSFALNIKHLFIVYISSHLRTIVTSFFILLLFQITEFNGELQGQGNISHGFSCVVFSGETNSPLTPKSVSATYTFTDSDLNRVCFYNVMSV